MHWLGDVRVDASYQKTILDRYHNSEYEEFVALHVTLPLTFSKEMKPRYLQITGDNNNHYSVTTRVNSSDGYNQLNTGLGETINIKNNINARYLNRDRNSANIIKKINIVYVGLT